MFIHLTRANVAYLKRLLIDRMRDVRSGHADEAMAAGMGFNTHAAMLAALGPQVKPKTMLILSENELAIRLRAFGYHIETADVTTAFAHAACPDGGRSPLNFDPEEIRSDLRKAVEALPENTGAARRTVYETIRATLVVELRAINPPLPSLDITARRLQLEDCIRQVEQEANEARFVGVIAREFEKLMRDVANQN